MKNKSKIKYIVLIIIQLVILFSCNNIVKENNKIQDSNETNKFKELDEAVNNSKIDYKYYDVYGLEPAKVIFPKNQTIAQGLSVLVNDGYGNLIVFDGGRVEDADYLCDIIKDNGGVVKTWFITHIHDDHIGALYKILSDKRSDIEIKELYYDFADFDWYYSKMGNDAGIYYLFINAIDEYNKFLTKNNKPNIMIYNKSNNFTNRDSFYYNFEDKSYSDDSKQNRNIASDSMSVDILNNCYLLDQDPINNTSIVYVVEFGEGKKVQMYIFGDLGYKGGEKLFDESIKSKGDTNILTGMPLEYNCYLTKNASNYREMYYDSIVVLSHHGQNGIDPELYKKFNPKVIVWPTSKDIYENTHRRYYTDDTKKVLSEIKSIECQIKSYEETAVIR